jgi:hypothetical protein
MSTNGASIKFQIAFNTFNTFNTCNTLDTLNKTGRLTKLHAHRVACDQQVDRIDHTAGGKRDTDCIEVLSVESQRAQGARDQRREEWRSAEMAPLHCTCFVTVFSHRVTPRPRSSCAHPNPSGC